jgi:dCTP diphosphatase
MDPTLREKIETFNRKREWGQFHTPANLAKSIVIEASELLEIFQWDDEADIGRVREELADVLIYAHVLAWKLGLDTNEIVEEKLFRNEEKYPVGRAKGSSRKYSEEEGG